MKLVRKITKSKPRLLVTNIISARLTYTLTCCMRSQKPCVVVHPVHFLSLLILFENITRIQVFFVIYFQNEWLNCTDIASVFLQIWSTFIPTVCFCLVWEQKLINWTTSLNVIVVILQSNIDKKKLRPFRKIVKPNLKKF